MNIKRQPLEFQNVISKATEDVDLAIKSLSDIQLSLMKQDVYATGPMFVKCRWDGSVERLEVPTNSQEETVKNTEFEYQKLLRYEDGLFYRDGNDNPEVASLDIVLHNVAADLKVELEDYVYCILLNVYGGKLYDIYAPIKGEL